MSNWLRDLWCSLFGHAPLEVVITRSTLVGCEGRPVVTGVVAYCPRCRLVLCGQEWLLARRLAEEVK